MRLTTSRLLPYNLPFKRDWCSHQGAMTHRRGWLLELRTDDGLSGYGDCAPLLSLGTETEEAAKQWLEQKLPSLMHVTPLAALEQLATETGHPAARHALETALLDLLSQEEVVNLRRWLSPTAADDFAVNASAGAIGETSKDVVSQLINQGFSQIKFKVGIAEVDEELRWLRQVARQLPAEVRLRLDANRAWSLKDATRFVQGLEYLPVESLEEPLNTPELATLKTLQGRTAVALALDESLTQFGQDDLFADPPVKRLILKPCLLGGLLPTKRWAETAKQAVLETVITSSLESAVGIQAACQLAAAVMPPSLAQGLATSDWFEWDLAQPPSIVRGRLELSTAPGLGISPYPAFLNSKDRG